VGYLQDIGNWTAGEVARRRDTRHFAGAIAGEGLSIIAEVKRASPSEGAIARDANPVAIAKAYEAAGAAAISVLTSERDFGGSLADLEAVRKAVDVPLLAKDFYVDPWQVIEARTHGADAILVILAMVEDGLALELQQQAEDLDMDVLCEVHSEDELRRALTLGFPVVGANARNLDTLEVNRAQGHDLLRAIPRGYVRVAESGIASKEDALAAKAAGANAALVGTALMRDPGLIQELVGL
jgi:indole-3-glycerol phosphate synthase